MKTIKQLADELGVSKTTIRKHLKEQYKIVNNENGCIEITPEGCGKIAESLRKPLKTTENQAETDCGNNTGNTENQVLVALLKQLEEKDLQIASLLKQNEALTEALDTSQKLHAGTIQTNLLVANNEGEAGEEKKVSEKKKNWFFKSKKQ